MVRWRKSHPEDAQKRLPLPEPVLISPKEESEVWSWLALPCAMARVAREVPGDTGKPSSVSGSYAFSFLTALVFTPISQHLHPLRGSPDLLGSLLEKGTWWW